MTPPTVQDITSNAVAVPERLIALAIVFGSITLVLVAWLLYRRGVRRDALIARLSARATVVYAAQLERDLGGKKSKVAKRGTVGDLEDLNAVLGVRERGKEGQL